MMLVIPRTGPFEARQYTGGPQNATPIINWILEGGGTATWDDQFLEEGVIKVYTNEPGAAPARAVPKDWIVKWDDSEFIVVEPYRFGFIFQELGKIRDPTNIERARRDAIQEAHDAQVQK